MTFFHLCEKNLKERGCTLAVITIGFRVGLVYWHLKCRIKVKYQKSWSVPGENDGCLRSSSSSPDNQNLKSKPSTFQCFSHRSIQVISDVHDLHVITASFLESCLYLKNASRISCNHNCSMSTLNVIYFTLL